MSMFSKEVALLEPLPELSFAASLFGKAQMMAMAAYPNDPLLVELGPAMDHEVYVMHTTFVQVHVLEARVHKVKDMVMGKFLTDQPHGPNGHGSGRIAIRLKPFLRQGKMAIMFGGAPGVAIVTGNVVLRHPGAAQSWGVVFDTSQLPEITIVATGLAAVAGYFNWYGDSYDGSMRAAIDLTGDSQTLSNMVVLRSSPVLTPMTLSPLRSVRIVLVTYRTQGVVRVTVSNGLAVFGSVYVDAVDAVQQVGGPTANLSHFFVDVGTSVKVELLVDGKFEEQRITIVKAIEPKL